MGIAYLLSDEIRKAVVIHDLVDCIYLILLIVVVVSLFSTYACSIMSRMNNAAIRMVSDHCSQPLPGDLTSRRPRCLLSRTTFFTNFLHLTFRAQSMLQKVVEQGCSDFLKGLTVTS